MSNVDDFARLQALGAPATSAGTRLCGRTAFVSGGGSCGHLMGRAHFDADGRALDPVRRQDRLETHVLPYEGTARDVAWAASFLAGPEPRWITGVGLNVDAGSVA